MPLLPLQLNDNLYLRLKEIADLEKIEILDYIRQRLAQPEGVVVVVNNLRRDETLVAMQQAATMIPPREPTADEIEAATAAFRPTFQAALDEDYRCGFTRSHLLDARQKLVEISIALGWPLAEILRPSRCACKDAQWLADRILKDLTWLEECLDKDASQAVEDAPPTWRSGATERIDPFWVVARDNNDGHELKATKRHTALPSAEFEAERLCARERVPFLVLQSVSRCEAGPVPVKWQLAKDPRP